MRRVGIVLCLVLAAAIGLAAWRFAPAPRMVQVAKPVDYELTAECLSERQSWRNFNSTLAELEQDVRFCVEVWPTASLSEP